LKNRSVRPSKTARGGRRREKNSRIREIVATPETWKHFYIKFGNEIE
jgi:hypothetical protein